MQLAEYVKGELNEHLIRFSINYRGKQLPRGIVLIDADNKPRRDHFCIADIDALNELANDSDALRETYVFVTRQDGAAAKPLPFLPSVSIYETDLSLASLHNLLEDARMRICGSLDSSAARSGFTALLNNVVSMDTTRADLIVEGMRALPNVNANRYRILVFDFDTRKTGMQISLLIQRLNAIFPYSNTSMYFGKLVVVAQATLEMQDSITGLSQSEEEGLRQVCATDKCRCGVTDLTHNWTMLRTLYNVANSTLEIGKCLDPGEETRVYHEQRYGTYAVLDYAYQSFIQIHHHDNYNYMIHPGVVALMHYDRKHNTNLREVLYQYLLNERNLTKAADALNMHRNTADYKMKKVVQIIDDNLDDPLMRQRLIQSCMICDYCERGVGVSAESFPDFTEEMLHP